jgi:hypothetical protein
MTSYAGLDVAQQETEICILGAYGASDCLELSSRLRVPP